MVNVAAATRLTAPEALPAWALIIRCVHQRGEDQIACLRELRRRGLWLSSEQRAATGLSVADYAAAYGSTPRPNPDAPAFAVVRQPHAGGRRHSYRVVKLLEIEGVTYGRDVAEGRWPDFYRSKTAAFDVGRALAAAAGGRLQLEIMERDFAPAAIEALRLA